MAKPQTLFAETRLYHPAEPEGRLFPAGEPWPGDAWSFKPGGDGGVGGGTFAEAVRELVAAQDTIEGLSSQVARNAYDRSVLASERDTAVNALGVMEQRALKAEKDLVKAEEAARAYMVERDTARAIAAPARVRPAFAADRALDIEIPDDWEDLPFFKLQSLASKVAGEKVNRKPDCIQAINRYLAAQIDRHADLHAGHSG